MPTENSTLDSVVAHLTAHKREFIIVQHPSQTRTVVEKRKHIVKKLEKDEIK